MRTHLDLFSGLGGFALACRMVGGIETAGFCEIDPFCRAVLEKHWPGVPKHDDIRTLDPERLPDADLWTSGFPCVDISNAGKRAGITTPRSGLWREVVRCLRVVRPKHLLVENVAALLGRGMGTVLGDLAESGYDAEWDCIPACAAGAPHLRERIWILANPASVRRSVFFGSSPFDLAWQRLQNYQQSGYRWQRKNGGHSMASVGWSVEPDIRGSDDVVPDRMDRLKAIGNSIVAPVAAAVLRAMVAAETAEGA